MVRLNLYKDNTGEYLAIVDSMEFENDLNDDGISLVYSVILEGDFTGWPTNRLFKQ